MIDKFYVNIKIINKKIHCAIIHMQIFSFAKIKNLCYYNNNSREQNVIKNITLSITFRFFSNASRIILIFFQHIFKSNILFFFFISRRAFIVFFILIRLINTFNQQVLYIVNEIHYTKYFFNNFRENQNVACAKLVLIEFFFMYVFFYSLAQSLRLSISNTKIDRYISSFYTKQRLR